MLDVTHLQVNAIKTTMRSHLTSVRMAKIKKTRNNKCWQRWGEKRILMHCWWECTLIIGTVENTTEVPQRIKNTNTLWSLNSTTTYLSKENKNINSKRYMNAYVHCSTTNNRQDIEITLSINTWIGKDVVCVCACAYTYI